jgi:hypothetical protein
MEWLASSLRRQLLGTRCGHDTRDKDEGGTTNVDARLICSHRRHLEAQKGSVPNIYLPQQPYAVIPSREDGEAPHNRSWITQVTRVTLEPLRGPSLR